MGLTNYKKTLDDIKKNVKRTRSSHNLNHSNTNNQKESTDYNIKSISNISQVKSKREFPQPPLRRSIKKLNPLNRLRAPEFRLDNRLKEVHVRGELVQLTPLEFRVIKFLSDSNNTIFSKDQIAYNCWEERNGDVSDDEIYTAVKRIRKKIEKDPDKPTLLLNKRGFGYWFNLNN